MSLWVISRHSGMSVSCPLYPRKRTCALVGTIELDEAQQNHGVAAQPSRSRLVCVFRRRYSDGVGAVVATYLTSVAWTQFDIGLILTIGTITGLALQIPAGALVDRVPAKRLLAALAVASISASALLLASGRSSAWWSLLKCCTRSQVHCSGLRLSRSALASSAMPCLALGSAATCASCHWEMRSRQGSRRHRLLLFKSGNLLSHGRARHSDTHRTGADPLICN